MKTVRTAERMKAAMCFFDFTNSMILAADYDPE
jgi:hypothetical protein